MSEVERQFEYRSPESGMLKLAGFLVIVMGPLMMWNSFQEPSGNDYIPGWRFLPIWMTPWIMRGIAFALVWVGYKMVRSAGRQQKFGGRIAFTKTGFIFEAGPPDDTDNEIGYAGISDVQIAEKADRRRFRSSARTA